MKIKLSIIFTLVITSLLSFSSTTFAALKSVPVPKLPTSQADFDTDLFTGSASYSYPIKVPNGTNGLTPDVSVSYNSSSAKGGSQRAGAGWQISHDFIERDVNFTPDASSTGDDTFILHFKGQTQNLIYVASESSYHTKIESHLRIKKIDSGGSNSKNAYWEVTEQNGTKYRFGYESQSELLCNGRDYVTQWDLDLVTDTHENKIFYTYTETDGITYPSTIKYNTDQTREIIFTYSANASKRWQYIQGCKIREVSKLANVKIKTSGSVVREFSLRYSTALNNTQLLGSITEKGSTTSASLPPTKFAYYPELKGWPSQSEPWANSTTIDANLAQSNVTLADVNGDTLLDIVKTTSSGGNYIWNVLINNGSNWPTSYATWATFGANIALANSDTKLIDVTGDGKPDIVYIANSGGNLTYKVYKNTGNSWNTSGDNWVTSHPLDGANITNANTQIIDVNGDNLPDIVKSQTGDATKWKVFKNTGNAWSTSPEDWIIPTGLDLTMNNLQVVDVNGDGLQDIVTTSVSGVNATWNVYANKGKDWDTASDLWINGVNIGNADLTKSYITLTDVNGDGLPDIVRDTDLGAADKWEVLLNLGNRWSTAWQTWIDTTQNVNVDSQTSDVRVADVNGDGLADIVRGKSGSTWEVWSNKGKSTDLLANITTSLGGLTSFEYASTSAVFDNTGDDALSDLPFSLQPVKKMTVNNGMLGAFATTDVTEYSYEGGMYDWEDKEFRGFAAVNIVQPNTSKMKYVFHQSDALQGLPVEVQTRDASNNPYFETESTWNSASSSGIFTVTLDKEKEYTYDGTESNPKVRETDYAYDSYGNVTKKSELGDFYLSGDERFTHTVYTASPSAWIVNTPNKIYLHAADDTTKVSETTLYYDGHTNIDAAPTKGDVTKEVKWLSGGTNPETEYEYDSYGNVTKIIDPNDNETTYTFNINDWTRTYPERITNAKGQQTTIAYDLGTGNILSRTDPNSITSDYEYDVFGRFAKEVKPYDTNAYPTVFYEYDFDGVAPEIITVRLREEGGNLHAVDTFTYIDGLNRKVQTRADAEDTNKQIVIDTYYDPTGAIKKESVPYLATASATLTSPSPTKFGDGSDGNMTIASNTTDTPIDSSVIATAGDVIATVGSGLGFAVNQIVLFHQTQGDYAGTWEFARVQSYSGTTLTLTTALANSYSSSGNNHAQVRVVRQYNNVTVNSGVTWTAEAWDGTTGGILAFLANGTLTVTGTITAAEKGFYQSDSTASGNNYKQGDSATGIGGFSYSANGTGGGGGDKEHGSQVWGGGGGGGHATSGTNGTAHNGGSVGVGGGTGGSTDLTTMIFGGGGGHYQGSYGIGGGIVFVVGTTVTIGAAGVISANGGNSAAVMFGSSSGGGGAGGSILIKAQIATLGTTRITVAGGTADAGGYGSPGGNGGVGRIGVEYETSLTGSTTPAANVEETQIPFIPAGGTEYASFDPDMEFTEWTYDPLGRVSIITNTKSDDKTIAYDHWKETEIDENGHIKRRYLNAYGNISKVEEVIGVTSHATNYLYNALTQLTQIIDSASNSATITYDTLGRKTAHNDPDMGTWTYGYDDAGNQTSTTDARNITTNRTYDELNRLTLVNYPNDVDSSFSYDLGKIGTLAIATDSAGTVFYGYDDRLRKIEETRVIGGTSKTTEFEYDRADRLTKQTNPDSTESEYTFNEQGEIESLTGILSDIDYNALGKITEKTFNNGLTTTYTYNTDDFRLNRIQTGSLQDLNYTYDPVGNITNIFNDITDKTQTFSYDDLDRLKTATESAGFSYAYEYNPIGNLTTFTDNGVSTDYSYGQDAGPHAMTSSMYASPTASNSGTPYGGTARTVPGTIQAEDFNSGGEGIGYHDVDSSNNGNSYRTSEGVDISEYASGQYNTGWTKEGEWLNYTITASTSGMYTFNVRVGSPFDNSIFHAEIDGVDVTGPIEVDNTGGWTNWSTLSKSGIMLTAGTHVLKIVMDQHSTQDQWIADIDWFSLTLDSTFGSPYGGTARAVTSTIQAEDYNTGGEGVGYHDIDSSNNGGSYRGSEGIDISEYASGQYNIGWTKEGEWLNYTVIATTSGMYTFNARVASPHDNSKFHAEIDGVDVTGLIEVDSTGGWTSWVTLSKSGIMLTAGEHILTIVMDEHSTQDQWIADMDWFTFTSEGPSIITYDANGNMTSEGGKCYEYNEANKLKKVTTCSNNQTIAEYIYDYKGQRMIKENYTNGTLANTVISWSDSFETKDIVGGSIETTNYFFANGELIAKKNPDGSKLYFHNDHLGSTTLTTNQAGAQVEVTAYDPWGKILGSATQSKFLYTGQEHDAETGLHYYDARYYDPDLKRFTQPDTIIQDMYNPQSLNRYSYALNNPLKYTDPSGHWSLKNLFTSAVKAVQSAVKAVSTFVSSIAPKPAPAPAVSTYKLPSNSAFQQPIVKSSGGGGSSGGSGNSGGSGGGSSSGGGSGSSINVLGVSTTTSTPTTNGDPFFNEVREKGYVDIGGSAGIGTTGFGGGGGTKLTKTGAAQYISGGGPTYGVSGYILFSTNPVKERTISPNFTLTLPGLATQFSFDPSNPFDPTKYKHESTGIGWGLGIEFGGDYTGSIMPYAPEIPNFRSKEYIEIFGY